MIPRYPETTSLALEHKPLFDDYTKSFEPYAEFSFPGLYCWDTEEETQISVLNGNLVMKMPYYITMEPFFSLIGTSEIDKTLDTLLRDHGELKMVPEVVVDAIENVGKYKITEDRDQFDYVYLLEDQVQLAGKHYRGRRKKGSKFYRTYEDSIEVRKIKFSDKNDRQQILSTFEDWAKDRNRPKGETEHEVAALGRALEAAPSFNLVGIQMFIEGRCVGFSINDVVSEDYAVCRFHKSLVGSYKHIDAFLSNLVAIELQHFGCKYLSWEQDLGIEGLRAFKESYKPVKYLKKYTISKR
jgi:hypothetical protein